MRINETGIVPPKLSSKEIEEAVRRTNTARDEQMNMLWVLIGHGLLFGVLLVGLMQLLYNVFLGN